jgi:hypothetical protein
VGDRVCAGQSVMESPVITSCVPCIEPDLVHASVGKKERRVVVGNSRRGWEEDVLQGVRQGGTTVSFVWWGWDLAPRCRVSTHVLLLEKLDKGFSHSDAIPHGNSLFTI